MYTDCTNPCTTLTKVGYPDCRKIAKGVTVRSNHVKFFSAGFRLAKQLTKVNMKPQKNNRYSGNVKVYRDFANENSFCPSGIQPVQRLAQSAPIRLWGGV